MNHATRLRRCRYDPFHFYSHVSELFISQCADLVILILMLKASKKTSKGDKKKHKNVKKQSLFQMGEVNYIISIRNSRRHTMKRANTASSSSSSLTPLSTTFLGFLLFFSG